MTFEEIADELEKLLPLCEKHVRWDCTREEENRLKQRLSEIGRKLVATCNPEKLEALLDAWITFKFTYAIYF